MHDDRELVERRIARELWDRVLPLVHADRRALDVEAGPDPTRLSRFAVGERWGLPWATTWFRLTGDIPSAWCADPATGRVEAVVDLGFTLQPPGFQAEGCVVAVGPDGSHLPRQGIHPRRTGYVLDATPGPCEVLVEAASNPSFPQFAPSPQGLPETASGDPLYRFRCADIVLVDIAFEALAHDLDVLDGVMRAMPIADPRRSQIRRAIVDALDALPDAGAARQAVAPLLAPPAGDRTGRRHRVVATGHAHIDTAWLWPTRETERKCARTFASVAGLMDTDPGFRFACSQAQQYAWIEERHPELFATIRDRVERGQWVPVGGMWVEADMNLPSGESLVRQIVHGQRYFEDRFGRRCAEAWIPDVFGYPAGLPQLFAAGGMPRFVTQKLSWNQQNRFPHHTFWWEGLDGTRVLTHFPPVDTYNAEITPGEVSASLDRFREHSWSGVSLMPFGHGDGGGGPTREMLARASRLADLDPRTTVELGTPADVFEQIEREAFEGAPVPVWRGELYLEMHRGTLTSQLRTKLGNRRCERLLVELELWAATGGERAEVDHLWRDVLTQQFHDILPGSSIAWVHRDAEATFDRVEAELVDRIDRSLARLAPTRSSLANPADVAVDGVVTLEATAAEAASAPADRIQHLDDGTVAATVSVPAFAVVALEPLPPADRVVVTESSMTNGRLAVRFDRHGTLTSVIDIAAQRDVLPTGALGATLELAPDHPVEYDAWDLESWTRSLGRTVGGGEVRVVDRGPLVGRVEVVRRAGPSTFRVTYELRADARQLLVHVDVDWQHVEHLLSIVFPIDVRADVAACDVQFGVVERPTHPSSPWEAAKFEVCAHRFVSVSEPSFGVAVLNDGRYGHCVFDGAIRVSLARAARYPDPDADRGRHAVTLALRPHDGDLADVRTAAMVLNRPVRTALGAHDLGGPGTVTPVVSVSADRPGDSGVEVDAVKLADDGSGDLVVRLHEAVGDRTRVTVRARTRIGAALRCNLLEEGERSEEVGDGIVVLTLRPFEIVTLRLVLTGDFDGR